MTFGSRIRFAFPLGVSEWPGLGSGQVIPSGAVAIVERFRVEGPRLEIGSMDLQVFLDGEVQVQRQAEYADAHDNPTINPYDPTPVYLSAKDLAGFCVDVIG